MDLKNQSFSKIMFILLWITIPLLICLAIIMRVTQIDQYWTKTITTFTIFLFSVFAFKQAPQIIKFGIPVGLLFCTIGDYTIIDNFFIGLVFFLIAHIVFLTSFILFSKKVSVPMIIIPFAVTFVIFFGLLFPVLGNMLIPVIIYSVIITIMVSFAFSMKNSSLLNYQKILIIVGAILFYISDIFVGINQFVWDIPYSYFFTYPFYFIGLTCFCAALYTIKKKA